MKYSTAPRAISLSLVFCVLSAVLFFGAAARAQEERKQFETANLETGFLRAANGANSNFTKTAENAERFEFAVSVNETEPNDAATSATALGSPRIKVTADIYPGDDIDFYSFFANEGDRVFAATMTAASAAGGNTVLDLIGANGAAVIETDDDDGTFGTTASSIAGARIPAAGVYYLRVRGVSATTQIRPYDLYLNLHSGASVAESEPNNTFTTATPISGLMSGAISAASDTADFYSFTANAGDTVFLSLDLDPERDGSGWNGRLGLGFFDMFFLTADDPGSAAPNSEAFFMTVKETGTYYVLVDSPTAAGTPGFTYNLSVAVFPPKEYKCTTYTPRGVGRTRIGPNPTDPNAVQFINVPDSRRIAKVQISVNVEHAKMADVDLTLTSPLGNEITIFNDVGSETPNQPGLTAMDVTFDDEAALPVGQFPVVKSMFYQPESFARLGWLKGSDARGTWTLTARDDAAGDAGFLNGWTLTVCEEPVPMRVSNLEETIYDADFESGDGGFAHSGTNDEWEWGTPVTNVPDAARIVGCYSGNVCWKTDLDGTYNSGSVQDLISPSINLIAERGRVVKLSWAQKYQIESASFDHYYVEVTEVGGSGMTRRLFEHRAGTMTSVVGNPEITIQTSSGWSVQEFDISEFAGKTIQLRFHLDSDAVGNYAGVAIDDVKIVAQKSPPVADYDGDGGTELSVYRNVAEDGIGGAWYLLNVSNNIFSALAFGLDTDIPVSGDFDGDGNTDIAVFRPSEGRWYFTNSAGTSFGVLFWGTDGDIPVPGDYDGDGKTDAAVYRPSNQTWYILRSSNGAVVAVTHGAAGDKLVPADYDGDGKTDIAVFRPADGAWRILQSFYGTQRIVQFGASGDTPVPADYDGDRKADIAVYRQGIWLIRRSTDYVVRAIAFGAPTDIPVPGDYDRDRKADIAVYRPAVGEWYVLRSSDGAFFGVQFGISSDIPIPAR
jgi:subtilisin-like proprotein convertase family protein